MLEIGDKVRLKQPEEIRYKTWDLLIPKNQQVYMKLAGHTLTVSDATYNSLYHRWLYNLRDDRGNEVSFRVFESEIVRVSDEAIQTIENEFAALIF